MTDWVILLILSGLFCVKNFVGLKKALLFRRAVKGGKYIRCYAEVTAAFGISGHNYFSRKYAKAKYSFDGKDVVGTMICAYDSRVDKGDRVTVIVPESDPGLFAFSEKQVGDAVLTYSVLSVVFAGLFILYTAGFLYLYTRMFR